MAPLSPPVPTWHLGEKADLERVTGLLCGCCGRPGYWSSTKDTGEHRITHSGRGWPCLVGPRDAEVRRVQERTRRLASEALTGAS